MRSEDLILEVDGIPVRAPDDLLRLMDSDAIGRRIPIKLYRNGSVLVVDVVPAELSLGAR
jgi:S1-C subfamily serine protease